MQDIQPYTTKMMRGVLDSLAESNNPKSAVNELVVDMDDALNDDTGAVIRVRGNPGDAISYVTTPFAGQQAIPILDLMNDVLQRRTGMSDAAKGLDPKQLQSSTQIGVEAIINGQQERTELIARVLAETGFKDLFEGLYNEIAESPNQRRTARINGKWTQIDTSTFDASMGVEVNSTLGKGSDTVRFQSLMQIKQTQEMIMDKFGTTNPVVGIPQYLNTIEDMLALSNIKNPSRYFMTPTPQVLQQIASTPKEPDAMTVAAKAQYEKVKSETAQAMGDQEIRKQKILADDTFRTRKLQQDQELAQQKLEIERAKVFVGAGPEGPTSVDPIEAAKIGVDIHQAHLDANLKSHALAMSYATDQAKIAQQREAAQLQAQTAQAAQQSNDDGGGDSS